MRRRQRFRGSLATLVPALCGLALLAPAPAAADDPALQSPFGGELPPQLVEPESQTRPPPGFEVSAEEAIGIADATDVVQAELAESPGAEPRALIRGDRWQVEYVDGDARVAEVIVDGSTGQVIEAWRDFQVGSPLARGYDGAIAQAVNSPWVWIALSLLFCAPFFDPRRPLRLLHLDLLVADRARGLAVLLQPRRDHRLGRAHLPGARLLPRSRMLVAGFWPRERAGPLIPWAPVRWLAIGVAVLAVGRIALNLVDSQVIDIGVAGVIGADRIADGEPLYEGAFSLGLDLAATSTGRSTTSPTSRSSSSGPGTASGTPASAPRTRRRSASTSPASRA